MQKTAWLFVKHPTIFVCMPHFLLILESEVLRKLLIVLFYCVCCLLKLIVNLIH
ncbi:virulence factor esxA [Listeria monocytogenes]|nr:virulence factor esxA [Listeria monocytogenes]GAM94194.1 virulence factor esxA [Listeria monocytogenes]